MSCRIAVYDGQFGYRSLEFHPEDPGDEAGPEAYAATLTVMYVVRDILKHRESYTVSMPDDALKKFYLELNEGLGALTDLLAATTDVQDLEYQQQSDFRFIGRRHHQVVIDTVLTR